MTTTRSNQVYSQTTGTTSTDAFITILSSLNPSTSSTNYPIGKRWVNTSTKTEFILANLESSNGQLSANWIELGGGSGSVETLTGNSGGVVPADGSNNINVRGDGSTINIAGNPGTNTLTANLITPLLVIDGGTGDIAFTPYTPICGGTTSTGNLQSVVSTGTAGQVLTSNGASSLPTFQSGSGSFTINVVAYPISGTYTPSASLSFAMVECVGGGGAGGGAIPAGTSGAAVGGGGGAGGYGKQIIPATSLTSPQAVVIGTGATGSTGTGANGGTTSFGTFINANGGLGGATDVDLNVAAAGGLGGSATTGDNHFITPGQPGQPGSSALITSPANSFQIGGSGGNSLYGAGGLGVVSNTTTGVVSGNNGVRYGAGGSGACAGYQATSNGIGGNGTAGYCVITEYIG